MTAVRGRTVNAGRFLQPTTNAIGHSVILNSSLIDPAARVAEELHPGRVFAKTRRAPGILDAPEAALGVRHEDGEAAVGGGEAGNALRAAARVVGIDLGRLAAVVDVAHADQRWVPFELCPAFAVCG